MPDVKISGLPSDSALDGNHYVPVNDPIGPTTKRTLLSTLAAFFFNQVNIPAGDGSPVTRADEMFADFVQTGLVITADSVGVNRNASMTAGVAYINGRRLSVSAVTARTYDASKDTYVDVLDNLDGTATVTYNPQTLGVAPPALAANSIRIGKVVTGASTIAATGSITQYGRINAVQTYPKAPESPFDWWEELGRVTLTAAGDTLSLTNLTPKRYLRVIMHVASTGGNVELQVRLNNDSGNSYSRRESNNGAADSTSVSQSAMTIQGAASSNAFYAELELTNVLGLEKVGYVKRGSSPSGGAGTAPDKQEATHKWNSTTAVVTRVDCLNLGGAGDYIIGSELIVLGHD